MSTRTASSVQLGNIALATNDHSRGLTPKLDSCETDDERFYMLATFCFDLSRKLKYISLALSEYYGDADPAFAKKIRDHEGYLNPRPQRNFISWQKMAVRAERVMKNLWKETHAAGHKKALHRLADQAPKGARRIPKAKRAK